MTLVAAEPLDALLIDLAARADEDGDPGMASRLVHLARLPARSARFARLERPLPPAIADRMPARLWTHQAEAIDLIRRRSSVVVASGTASGKSLCYQAPIAEAIAAPIRPGTALLVFPTKALAHDQLRALTTLGFEGLVAGAYDGDAGAEERTWIRRHANAVLTNPEMLHCGIVPNHARWATFLSRLRYVVIDELHAFRGIFGSHVAHVVRRLRRIAAHYGADPTFVCCSATIGEPESLASGLCAEPTTAVLDDGSPRGERVLALWNPPMLDPVSGVRTSAHSESAALLAELVRAGRRSIAFCRSRRGTEVVAADAGRRLGDHTTRIRPYRAGYLAEERRSIEDALSEGGLDGVVATSALELGIDIGGLDAVVVDGFPGTIASFWQQVGRAGRAGAPAAAVLVAGSDQLDQWLAAHPAELLTRPPEPAVINPTNPYVLDPHLRCAAFELPLRHADERWWPDALDDGVRRLAIADELDVRWRGRRGVEEPIATWAGSGWPTHGVGLRTSQAGEVRIVTAAGDLVGTVDLGRAFEHVHMGASYLHLGSAWRVLDLDVSARVATVEPDDGTEYTVARSTTEIQILNTDRTAAVGRVALCLGSVEVTTQVVGYQRKEALTGNVLGAEVLDLPPSSLKTRAFWYVVGSDVLAAADIDAAAAPGALHAVEHAAIGMLPLFTICDRWDVGGLSTTRLAETGAPTIVVYDAYAGGAGVAELGFEAGARHLGATLDAIAGCACATGCPSCVQSPKCGNGNDPLDKAAAVRLLEVVLSDERGG